MSNAAAPRVGSWYRSPMQAQSFQVVAIDQHARAVEILCFDGTLDEWPLSHWPALDAELCAGPRDCRGAFELERGDAQDDAPDWDHAHWLDALESAERACAPSLPPPEWPDEGPLRPAAVRRGTVARHPRA